MHSDKEIIEGIASNNREILTYVYNDIYPCIQAYVIHHGGTDEHAKDIFQDAMFIVFKKIKAEELSLHCKFSTYLYAVSKILWIQDRKKQLNRLNKLKEISAAAESETPYGHDSENEVKELFNKHFKRLGPDCQKILTMYFNEMTIEEIMVQMGFNSLHQISDKKYRCKKNLIEMIKRDPLFRKFKK
jgi:RNA polymerase sigma factor (sigma-70 family)